MARGKHRIRAQKLRAEREARQRHDLAERLGSEQARREAADAALVEMAEVAEQVRGLREQVVGLEPERMTELRSTVAGLVEQLLALAAVQARERRHRNRGVLQEVMFAGDVATTERFFGEATGRDVFILDGVYQRSKLPQDALATIQRARGFRAPGES